MFGPYFGLFAQCKRLIQGHISAGDAYTYRYDDLTREVKDKVKCVENTCLFKLTIEKAFFHCWDYLTLCAKNGIVINEEKFQLYRDYITFAGLNISPTGIRPYFISDIMQPFRELKIHIGLYTAEIV